MMFHPAVGCVELGPQNHLALCWWLIAGVDCRGYNQEAPFLHRYEPSAKSPEQGADIAVASR